MTLSFTENEWEEYSKSSKIMFTSCKDCVFSSSPGECSCGRLQQFQKNDVEIVDVKSTEEESPHKVVSGRICNMFRTDDWEKALRISGKPQDHLEKAARKEIRIQCSFIIICPDDEEIRKISDEKELRSKTKEKISQIIKTMKSIDSAEIPPQEIILLNESWIQPYDFINYLRIQCSEENIKCKWRLEHFSKENFENQKNEELEKVFIKNVFKTIKTGYCSIFHEGDTIPEKYLYNIDQFLNDELKAFLLLTPKEGVGGMIINSILFKQFLGNKSKYTLDEFFEQVKKIVEEQKCAHLIQPLDKILQRQG